MFFYIHGMVRLQRVIPPSAHDNPATHYESTVQHVYQPPRKGTRDEQATQQKSFSPRKNQYPMPSAMKGTRRAQMEAALWEQAK